MTLQQCHGHRLTGSAHVFTPKPYKYLPSRTSRYKFFLLLLFLNQQAAGTILSKQPLEPQAIIVKMQFFDPHTIFDEHGFTVVEDTVHPPVQRHGIVLVESHKDVGFTRFTIFAGREFVMTVGMLLPGSRNRIGGRIRHGFCLDDHLDWGTFQTGDGSRYIIDNSPAKITFDTDKIHSPDGIRRLHINVMAGNNYGMSIFLPMSESATSKALGPCSLYQPPARPEVILTGKWYRYYERPGTTRPLPPSTLHLERRRARILNWVKAKVNRMAGSKKPGKKDSGPTVPAVRDTSSTCRT
ncbi:hypothetical protein QBC39DRAFT_357858 [Podospora conica]|nr:hypothetical protein QBC39DRAFT_357858 [Schizothecium conicum]